LLYLQVFVPLRSKTCRYLLKMSIKLTNKSFRWVILVACILFLSWKLAKIDNFSPFFDNFKNISDLKIVFLIFSIILLPLNFLVEGYKWKFLLSIFHPITLWQSIKAVLWGQTGAFITPNSIGEFPTRAMNLPKKHRITAISMGFAGSFAQTAAVSFFGVFAAPIFIYKNVLIDKFPNFWAIIIFGVIISLSILLFFFLLPKISIKIKTKKNENIKKLLSVFSKFNFAFSLKIIAISTLKYLIFSAQFYFILRFCGVDFSPCQALVAMPTFYLLLTYTPLFNAVEAAVRASIGALVFGIFCTNTAGIIAASILFWFLNFCIPTVCGLFFAKGNSKTTL